MAKRYANITGWGKYIPERVLTNFDLEKMVDTTDEWILARTGIRERHIVSEGEVTSLMATEAGRQALHKAGLWGRDLDLIIVASSSPDYLTPPVSSQVQEALGARGVGAFTLVTGCTGFVYALATAQQFIAAGTADRVLVIGAEIITRWVDWNDRSTCVLFGDGAGAVVLEATDEKAGVLSYVLGSDGAKGEYLIVPGGGTKHPSTHQTIDEGLHHVKMNGHEVFKFATRVMGRALKESLKKANLEAEDIDLFIPHQANKRIIDSAARQIGLPEDKVFVNIHKYGNTSAASIPIALCEALDEGRAKPGDLLALVAFGAGLTWASAVVKLGEREKGKRRLRLPFFGRVSFNGWLGKLFGTAKKEPETEEPAEEQVEQEPE